MTLIFVSSFGMLSSKFWAVLPLTQVGDGYAAIWADSRHSQQLRLCQHPVSSLLLACSMARSVVAMGILSSFGILLDRINVDKVDGIH